MTTLEIRQVEQRVFFLVGEFDMSCEQVFDAWLPVICEGHGPVVLDLRDLTFIDSTGIRAMLLVCMERPVVLRKARGQVRRVLEISGLAARHEIAVED